MQTFGEPVPSRRCAATSLVERSAVQLFRIGYSSSAATPGLRQREQAYNNSAIVPTDLERIGDFSRTTLANGSPLAPIRDPLNAQPDIPWQRHSSEPARSHCPEHHEDVGTALRISPVIASRPRSRGRSIPTSIRARLTTPGAKTTRSTAATSGRPAPSSRHCSATCLGPNERSSGHSRTTTPATPGRSRTP